MSIRSDKPQLLYVGGFEFPDRNAAAQRVLAIAKVYAVIGYEVCFLSYSPDAFAEREVDVQGFRCLEFPAIGKRKALYDISAVELACSKLPNLHGVIAYNYPALALWKLRNLCSRRGLLCIGDITEWYSAKGYAPIKRELKALDIFFRMRILNKRMDGLIVISRYLEMEYSCDCPVALIPPLIDKEEKKWQHEEMSAVESEAVVIGYAGSASRTKERLDIVLESAAAAHRNDLRFRLIGLSRRDYLNIYGKAVPKGVWVEFLGRLPHEEALQVVSSCDYTIVVRDDNRVTRAGFPTKFVESIASNTPVICNDNSDLACWVDSQGCGIMCSLEELKSVFTNLKRDQVTIADRWVFDYRRYEHAVVAFMGRIEKGDRGNHDYK